MHNKLINSVFAHPKLYKILSGPAMGAYLYFPLRAGIRMYLGFWEASVAEVIKREVKENDVCMDLGSHVGYFTVMMAKIVGERGSVYSFEPIRNSFDLQKRSIKENGFNNVKMFDFALGDENVEQKGYVFSDSGMAHFDPSVLGIEEDHESSVFEIKTLDNVPEIRDLERLDFMKIDIEGFEHKALKGGYNTISKHKPNILVEIHNQENYIGVYELLKELDYSFYDLDMNKVDLKTDFGKQIFHIYAKAK